MLLVLSDRKLKLYYDMLKPVGLLGVPAIPNNPLFKGERFQGVLRLLNPPLISQWIHIRSQRQAYRHDRTNYAHLMILGTRRSDGAIFTIAERFMCNQSALPNAAYAVSYL
jgi:hypothetical protein